MIPRMDLLVEVNDPEDGSRGDSPIRLAIDSRRVTDDDRAPLPAWRGDSHVDGDGDHLRPVDALLDDDAVGHAPSEPTRRPARAVLGRDRGRARVVVNSS